MKKLILLTITIITAMLLNSCAKDDDLSCLNNNETITLSDVHQLIELDLKAYFKHKKNAESIFLEIDRKYKITNNGGEVSVLELAAIETELQENILKIDVLYNYIMSIYKKAINPENPEIRYDKDRLELINYRFLESTHIYDEILENLKNNG